jgi:hypothetical protein
MPLALLVRPDPFPASPRPSASPPGRAARLRPTPGPAGAYVLTYRPGFANLCPGCHATHWHVGRLMAECACCGAALPIATERPGWARAG